MRVTAAVKRALWIEARIAGLCLLVGITLGGVFGVASLGGLAGAVTYILRHLRFGVQMMAWLERERPDYPPDAQGVWDEIFHRLYLREKAYRERKRELRRLLIRFQQSTRAIPDALVLLGSGYDIQWTNSAADRLLGISVSKDRSRPIVNLVRHPDFSSFLEDGCKASLTIPSPTDPKVSIEFRLVGFAEGQHLLIVRDSTERQRIESMRRDFVANVSHELRTPLTVLGGYLENFQRDPDRVPATWRRPIAAMSDQTERMRRLVEDLLMLARIESSPAVEKNQVVDVPALIAVARHDAAELGGAKRLTIEADMDDRLRLWGAFNDLQTIVVNLVSNAVQYTGYGGHIQLRWFAADEGAFFEVQDDGDGIGQEHLPRLTERFYRVDKGRSRDRGGTGLGLAIVKHLLDHYGAKLHVTSKVGQGSTFSCQFPAGLTERSDGQPQRMEMTS
ncbi:MAG: phosphate regulon sensor histidine kinase PhoR [Gammaproteobacteria bacterium]|nr:phosphate regulon sensor histidine kinase PhoR [Gammaproteobacteria bacterium]